MSHILIPQACTLTQWEDLLNNGNTIFEGEKKLSIQELGNTSLSILKKALESPPKEFSTLEKHSQSLGNKIKLLAEKKSQKSHSLLNTVARIIFFIFTLIIYPVNARPFQTFKAAVNVADQQISNTFTLAEQVRAFCIELSLEECFSLIPKLEENQLNSLLKNLKIKKEVLEAIVKSFPHKLVHIDLEIVDENTRLNLACSLYDINKELCYKALSQFKLITPNANEQLADYVLEKDPKDLASNIVKYTLSPVKRFELAQKIAKTNPEALASYVDFFKIENEGDRKKIADIILNERAEQLAYHFDHFNISDEQDRFNYALQVFEKNADAVIISLHKFDLHENSRIKLAHRLLEKDYNAFAQNFKEFKIESKGAILELLNKLKTKSHFVTREYLIHFDLTGEEREKLLQAVSQPTPVKAKKRT